MKHLYATYKSQGFRIISVSCEQNRTYWLRGNDRLKLPWTTLRSPARKGCALDLYSMLGISALILIDRDGTIRNANGSSIGKVDSNGTVRNGNGSSIGKVESDGTVRNGNGSSIGKVSGVPKEWAAAYFFFFF
jgi:hypothetical protein